MGVKKPRKRAVRLGLDLNLLSTKRVGILQKLVEMELAESTDLRTKLTLHTYSYILKGYLKDREERE